MKKYPGTLRCLVLLLLTSLVLSVCPVAIAQAEEVYLSDLTPMSYYDETAPVMNANRKGEAIAFADGTTYEKGVSFSAAWNTTMNGFYAGAVYDVSGYTYNRFSAMVGSLTDYVSEDIMLIYMVLADGQPIAITNGLRHSAGGYKIDVAIPSETKQLEIRMRALPNNICGTGCFADAKLYNGDGQTVEDTNIYVSDLTATSSYGNPLAVSNADFMGGAITFSDGITALKGVSLSAAANEELDGYFAGAVYDISALDVNHFSATVGSMMDYIKEDLQFNFTVLADDVVVGALDTFAHADGSKVLNVFFPEGTQKLELRMETLNEPTCGTGCFANPVLSKQEVPAEEVYLNDLTPTSWYGEKEPVVNQNLAGGQIAFADGKTFTKGVSFSNAWVAELNWFYAGAVYDISGYTYNRFSTTVGSLTDYTSDATYMYYAVMADGKVLAVTPIVNHSAGSFEIDVEIPRGAKNIELRTMAYPNNSCGTAAFADPKLYNGEADPEDDTIYVSDLPTASYFGDGAYKVDTDRIGSPIAFMDGYTAEKGVSMSVGLDATLGWVSYATYDISALDVNHFSARVGKGMDYFNGSTTELTFAVLVDGVEYGRSKAHSAVTADSSELSVTFPAGSKTLELRMYASPNNICGTGAFADPILSKVDVPVEDAVYLDTLTPTSWYGEKEPVVNQNLAGGQIAFADGKAFTKGVSFSNAWVGSLNGFFAGAVYDISGYTYNRFSTTVGSLTDYMSDDTIMYYAVMVDGKPLEVTEWMTHSQGSVVIDVEIPAGAKTLELRSRAMPTNSCATLCFADAKLYNGEADPVDNTLYVSDLTPTAVSADGGLKVDTDCLGSPIAYLDGYTAEKGIAFGVVHNETLGWHASATYDVSELDVNHISTRVGKGMDYFDGSTTELTYTILADGEIIAVSTAVSAVNKQTVQLDAFFPEGTKTLEFRMQSAPTNSCGTGSFANAILSKQEVPVDEVYLSDLTPTSYFAEQAPRMDTNFLNGAIAFADGSTYAKGVSFSIDYYGDYGDFFAFAKFDVSSYTYNRFSTIVGSLTDYVSEDISMSYMVFADGKLLAATDYMRHSQSGKEIDVEIPAGTKEIELRVRSMPNNACGTVCFANAKLYHGEAEPVDSTVYLSDLTPTTTYGDGLPTIDTDRRGLTIAYADGKVFEKGIGFLCGLNAEMDGFFAGAVYDVSAYDYNHLSTVVGSTMDYHVGATTQYIFTIIADGKVIAQTEAVQHEDGGQVLDVYFPEDTKTLEIRVQTTPDNNCGTSAFAAPVLTKDEIPEEIQNQWIADEVMGLIDTLPETVAVEDEDTIGQVRSAYDVLSDAQKALVTNLDKLTAAEAALAAAKQAVADKAIAEEVEKIIAALPAPADVVTEDEAEIVTARNAYNALSDAQKGMVSNLDVLLAAESALVYAIPAAVQAVIQQIASFKTAANKKGIAAARAAYDALSEGDQALVTNLSRLEELENDIVMIAKVTAQIDAIQPGDQAAISAARAAYNALTFNQKMLITNESRFVELELALHAANK